MKYFVLALYGDRNLTTIGQFLRKTTEHISRFDSFSNLGHTSMSGVIYTMYLQIYIQNFLSVKWYGTQKSREKNHFFTLFLVYKTPKNFFNKTMKTSCKCKN